MGALMDALQPFVWKDGKAVSPEEVARLRKIAEAAMGGAAPTTFGGGLNALGADVAGIISGRRANAGEEAGRAHAGEIYRALLSGEATPEAALGDQWLAADDGMSAVAQAQMKEKMNPTGEESLFAPIAGYDSVSGNPIFVQAGNKGSTNVMDMPDNFTPQGRFEKIDLGTEWLIKDTTTGQSERVPKNNQQAALDTALGTAEGKAASDKIQALPGMLAKSDNMLFTIDGILNDPALDSSTGWLSFLQGVPGTDQFRFGQRALQLQGQAFLQAFESLRGGGQITEAEGTKATQAIGRLSTVQSPEDYRAALEELKGIIGAAKARTQAAAGVPATSGTPGGLAPPDAEGWQVDPGTGASIRVKPQ